MAAMGTERDAGGGQRADRRRASRAPAVHAVEDDRQHDGRGQVAEGHEALLDHVLDQRDPQKSRAGSHWPGRASSEQARHRTKAKPKNQSRRSRQKASTPAASTARKPQPR